MSHDPMGPWDEMDSRTHASVEGQVDIPWKVPWGCGIGWTIPCNPMIPWDRGMGWTIYGISGQPSYFLAIVPSQRLCTFRNGLLINSFEMFLFVERVAHHLCSSTSLVLLLFFLSFLYLSILS